MALNYKNIVITPNIGNTADPKIQFSGGNTTVNTDISMFVYPESNGTLSFEGSTGQLFSITNDLSGSIFSVNDISGIPSIDVFANGQINLAPFGGRTSVGGDLLVGTQTSFYSFPNRGTLEIYGITDALHALRNGIGISYFHKVGHNLFLNNGPSGFISILTSSSERMRITSDGDVGIGTTTATAKLHVTSPNRVFDNPGNLNVYTSDAATVGAGGAIALGGVNAAGGTSPYVFAKIQGIKEGATNTWNGALLFGTTASTSAVIERMRITSAGNIGIGVTPAPWVGDAGKALQINNLVIGQNVGFDVSEFITNGYATSGSAYAYIGSASATRYRQSSGNHLWERAISGTAGGAITWIQQMYLNTSGNIGVGTTNPISKMHLEGSTTDVTLTVVKTGSGFATYFSNDGTNLWLGSGQGVTGKKVIINQSTTDNALTIDSAGSTIVGAAAVATNATGGFLYIPTCAGTPTGTPISYTGRAPLVVDSTNNKLYMYSGGAWVALN